MRRKRGEAGGGARRSSAGLTKCAVQTKCARGWRSASFRPDARGAALRGRPAARPCPRFRPTGKGEKAPAHRQRRDASARGRDPTDPRNHAPATATTRATNRRKRAEAMATSQRARIRMPYSNDGADGRDERPFMLPAAPRTLRSRAPARGTKRGAPRRKKSATGMSSDPSDKPSLAAERFYPPCARAKARSSPPFEPSPVAWPRPPPPHLPLPHPHRSPPNLCRPRRPIVGTSKLAHPHYLRVASVLASPQSWTHPSNSCFAIVGAQRRDPAPPAGRGGRGSARGWRTRAFAGAAYGVGGGGSARKRAGGLYGAWEIANVRNPSAETVRSSEQAVLRRAMKRRPRVCASGQIAAKTAQRGASRPRRAGGSSRGGKTRRLAARIAAWQIASAAQRRRAFRRERERSEAVAKAGSCRAPRGGSVRTRPGQQLLTNASRVADGAPRSPPSRSPQRALHFPARWLSIATRDRAAPSVTRSREDGTAAEHLRAQAETRPPVNSPAAR